MDKSHEIILRIYELSSKFPSDERYGVRRQIRRSSASIPNYIAEGCGRDCSADFALFLQIALGFVNETEYLILLSKDLDYTSSSQSIELHNKITTIKKMFNGLKRKLTTTN